MTTLIYRLVAIFLLTIPPTTQSQTSYHKNYIPIQSKEKLDQSTLDDLFQSSFQSYICSSLLINDFEKVKEGAFLRFYSEKTFLYKSQREKGRNWNDINFPAGLEAWGYSETKKQEVFLEGGECYLFIKLTDEVIQLRENPE